MIQSNFYLSTYFSKKTFRRWFPDDVDRFDSSPKKFALSFEVKKMEGV